MKRADRQAFRGGNAQHLAAMASSLNASPGDQSYNYHDYYDHQNNMN